MLSLGCELTSLGLNLNSPHPLYTTLASVYTANQPDLPLDPHFHTPQCYRLKPSTDNESSSLSLLDPAEQIAASSDDALFYAFYAFPRDRIQEAAAQELYSRGWRFHKDIKVWLTKDTPMPAPGLTNLSGASLSASPSLSESAGVAGAADGSKGTPKVGAGAGAGGSEKESSVSPAVAPSTTGASATTATSNNNNSSNTPVEFIAGERGLFVFFDPAHWQRVKKEWVVNLDVLEERNDATSRQNNGNNSRNGASVNNDER
ncbi:hypothetical protein BCR33DRAFT_711749 [Rhizoclosmatium globosum]|uniref:NOT2/NOT3/NOT5 C-terminal domain-containing protein n=1 Tax=Rhizoclosmatium globosum TaxID=329046 RepID=A0A1Y2CZG3_9FUNG|nr:hypothetical protein BCR33DRAFT_711749 [Rhizoclosmatium globosum]|eukprot:ORY52428.1 hypothetical protein BCR33DRAFT_711749 [Rhizoclosmatium globosum]